jgi:hypothetical protein
VYDILDEIEMAVNEVYDRLNKIEGLTEIDEIKGLLGKISADLY